MRKHRALQKITKFMMCDSGVDRVCDIELSCELVCRVLMKEGYLELVNDCGEKFYVPTKKSGVSSSTNVRANTELCKDCKCKCCDYKEV